ncbi:TPA: SHOCT domain-containing protein [Burkholderia vietnamiensis]|nr:SHOCT domain-containing protein [Burkholderia vietnamiensis]
MADNKSTGLAAELPKAWSHLDSMLVAGETVQASTVQRRLFALTHRRALVAATSGRLIGMKRGLIGGFSPIDLRWQDIKTAHIKAGIFGSTLTVTALTQPDLASGGAVRGIQFSGLRKDEAQAVYRICQAQEQAWREKRRQRELEEMRAKSGGFQGSFGDSTATTSESPTERLQKAKAMLDQGLISDSEYETIKAKVISQF